MAIVGFGDEFLASLIEPSLTTVDLHPYRIGQQALLYFSWLLPATASRFPQTVFSPRKTRKASRKTRRSFFRVFREAFRIFRGENS